MLHIRKFEIPYFLAFFLYGFSIIVNTDSYISTFFPMYMNAIIKYTAMALLFVSLLYRRWPLKRLIGWTAVGILAVVISFVVDKPTLVLSAAILICANEVDFERIKKCTIIFNVIYIVIIVGACVTGFIPDLVFDHNTKIAHSFGFYYYSTLSSIILMISLIAFSLKGKNSCSYPRILLLTFINGIVYVFTTTRLTFYLYLITVFLVIVIQKKEWISIKNTKFIRILAVLAFPIAAFLCLAVSVLYNPGVPWMKALNAFLTSRIRYNHAGFLLYGVSLFGKPIEMVGGTELANGVDVSKYFYIDSGYVYTLLEYGILIYVLMIIGYALLFRYAVKKEDKSLFIWCVAICIHALINNVLIDFELNPLLLGVPMALQEIQKSRQERARMKKHGSVE